jgi:hypothetical protein
MNSSRDSNQKPFDHHEIIETRKQQKSPCFIRSLGLPLSHNIENIELCSCNRKHVNYKRITTLCSSMILNPWYRICCTAAVGTGLFRSLPDVAKFKYQYNKRWVAKNLKIAWNVDESGNCLIGNQTCCWPPQLLLKFPTRF